MTKNNSNWKEIEEEFRNKFTENEDNQVLVLKHSNLDLFINANIKDILKFFKPYFQERLHTKTVKELESVDCQWENCSGGRYCEKHSLEIVDNNPKE